MIAHKIVSKAEGRTRALADVEPSPACDRARRGPRQGPTTRSGRARRVQRDLARVARRPDLRHQARLRVRQRRCGRIQRPGPGHAWSCFPSTPTPRRAGSAQDSARRLGVAPAVVITDSFGRAWRHGQCDVAIGCAGIAPLEDWRGRRDAVGRELTATWIAIADELASAADLARIKGRQATSGDRHGRRAPRHRRRRPGRGGAAPARRRRTFSGSVATATAPDSQERA